MAVPVQQFIDLLTRDHRVLVIGGLAVIAHGHDRHTRDADIWLEPLDSVALWAATVEKVSMGLAGVSIRRLPGWTEVRGDNLVLAVEETGMVRIHGLDRPLDIFRRPNEFLEGAFDEVAERARKLGDGTFLVDPVDLIQSKLATGRARDQSDIFHLEQIVRANYENRLPRASFEEARALFGRFADWKTCSAALRNPDERVRQLARRCLAEFATEGDPFSKAILEGRTVPCEERKPPPVP